MCSGCIKLAAELVGVKNIRLKIRTPLVGSLNVGNEWGWFALLHYYFLTYRLLMYSFLSGPHWLNSVVGSLV